MLDTTKPTELRFQSTFPRGERRMYQHTGRKHWHFNPRSRVGNDAADRRQVQRRFDFNPRSRVGNDYDDDDSVSHGQKFQSTFPRGERLQISTIFHLYICISSTNSHFSITSFCIFYLIHFFLICFFQLFMVRIFWGFSVYFWFALYRNNT